jgi:hypothetical protein
MPTVRNPPLRTSLETRHIRRTASAIEAAQSRAAQWGQATPFCVLFTRPPAPRNVEICCYSDCSCVPCGGEALASAPCFAFPKQSGAGFRTLLEGSRLGDFLRPLWARVFFNERAFTHPPLANDPRIKYKDQE